ncbi:hypothetical protein EVAR_98488_1 [Eumeta japonica]|uniref:Uncharacterized protein n=1 Tax=Eumeta variegata TaxID=151549 RepID=A0A4C1YE09_EUMVA|nr:hypothetical protein EVAR_98488_1 [Eumeta japonica]
MASVKEITINLVFAHLNVLATACTGGDLAPGRRRDSRRTHKPPPVMDRFVEHAVVSHWADIYSNSLSGASRLRTSLAAPDVVKNING